ncbi:undecaprenyl diphosphate synthase family protein [Streptomyces griseofuscus]|uniref:undecaprenyl diphosphate synthase family protein n=1 Tax=Streptomyces griseofuscus TaxID=146922 RepID=UPI0036FB28D4
MVGAPYQPFVHALLRGAQLHHDDVALLRSAVLTDGVEPLSRVTVRAAAGPAGSGGAPPAPAHLHDVLMLTVCVDYGSIRPEDIGPAALTRRLYVPGPPDVDLLMRTSAEQRISNFLPWQLAYAGSASAGAAKSKPSERMPFPFVPWK